MASSTTTTQGRSSVWAYLNNAGRAMRRGGAERGVTPTEPGTDVAPTLTVPAATVDWVPNEPGASNPQSTEPAPMLAGDFERVIAHRYCLVREIGRGGFGIVYLAYDRDLHRQVAIKIASCDDGRGVDHLLEEGRKVAQLDHENIVPVYDCGRINERTIFIVSKYIDGGSLARRIALRKMPISDVIRIAGQVADALSHAHERGLIHRDLKPSNILIDSADRIFVADFGLAIRTSDRSDRHCIEGSPLYMSPEQAEGKSRMVDRRTDVFSFGAILYEMLTGKRPFASRRFVQDDVVVDPPAPHVISPEVPEPLSEICLKAMSRQPSDRYASAWELARALKDWEASQSKCPRLKRMLIVVTLLLASVVAAWLLSPLVARALWNTDRTRDGLGGISSTTEPPILDKSLDREVAQWVLKVGGQLDIEDHHPPRISRVDQLPRKPFTIKAITLLSIRSVGDADIKKLANLKDLLYLHLSETGISDESGADLARLGKLRYLWLGWNHFGDRGLTQLEGLKNLEHLNLERADVTDMGVLAAVGSPKLDYLDLSETRITDAGLARLQTLPSLRHLGLNRTAITDASVESLLKIKNLRRLEIAETALSDAAVARLRAGLTGCYVMR